MCTQFTRFAFYLGSVATQVERKEYCPPLHGVPSQDYNNNTLFHPWVPLLLLVKHFQKALTHSPGVLDDCKAGPWLSFFHYSKAPHSQSLQP